MTDRNVEDNAFADNLPEPGRECAAINLAAIVEGVCNQDHQAFTLLYQYYQQPLVRYLMTWVHDKEDALDLSQETFLRVWQHIVRGGHVPYHNLDFFQRWFYCVAKRVALDYIRHYKRFTFQPLPESEPNGFQEYAFTLSVPRYEDQICSRLYVEQIIAAMSSRYGVCWALQFFGEYSQRQIAQVLGISEKTVSANVSRGAEQLRRIYAHMMDE